MSSKRSFSNETSERYALALYELSKENNELAQIETNVFDILNLYKSNRELKNFITNPSQTNTDQIRVIEQISKIMKFPKIFTNFLFILVKKKRIFFMESILNMFLILNSKKRGELKATLTSPKKLTEEEVKNLNEEISKVVGSKILFDHKIDESLIGGLKVQIGSLMVDTSIKNKLKKYEKLMLEL